VQSGLRDIAEKTGAPTLVLVPGLDGTALLFYRQIPLLARRFNVIAFPFRDDPSCDMADLVEDLRQLISEAGAGPVVLCGESFGGALSLSFALEHPQSLSGLVIVNSFSFVHQRVRLRVTPYLLRAVPWAAMPLVRRFTESRMHSPHAQPEDLREFHERSRQIGRRGYIRRLEILWSYDIRARLPEIEVPVLFLAGDRDELVPSVEEARFMSARLPDAEVQILGGYGHICLINHDLDLLDYVGPWYHRKARESGSVAPDTAVDLTTPQ
jgi:pimeloyl-ACP methyl ester carboxylesterase